MNARKDNWQYEYRECVSFHKLKCARNMFYFSIIMKRYISSVDIKLDSSRSRNIILDNSKTFFLVVCGTSSKFEGAKMVEEEWRNRQVPKVTSAEVCFLIWSLGLAMQMAA